MKVNTSMDTTLCPTRRRWLAHAACAVLAVSAVGCRDNTEAKAPASDVHAATAAIDTPTQDVNELLRNAKQTHSRFQIEPGGAKQQPPTLELILPKAWQHAKPSATSPIFPSAEGVISDLHPQLPVAVAVEFSPAPHDVPIDALLRHKLQREGWQLIDGRLHNGEFGEFYEATAIRTLGKSLIVNRASARLHQGTLTMISAGCPRERWDELKSDLWLAHAAAELLGTKPDGRSEARKRVASLAEPRKRHPQPLFETEYPASWAAEIAASSDNDISGIHFRLASGDVLQAYIVARAERHDANAKPDVSQLIARAKRQLEGAGGKVTTEPKPVTPQDDLRAQSVAGWLGTFSSAGELGGTDIDIRMSFSQSKRLTFALVMLSPTPKNDLIAALRAQRAFEIIRAGLSSNEFSAP
jgi:hypothetical protein